MAGPGNRKLVFSTGLVLFFLGGVTNLVLFNAVDVLIIVGCLVLAKPLLDLCYNPIELRVVDVVSGLERRNEYAYFFNHESGLFLGRFLGCGLFLAIAYGGLRHCGAPICPARRSVVTAHFNPSGRPDPSRPERRDGLEKLFAKLRLRRAGFLAKTPRMRNNQIARHGRLRTVR